MKANNAQTGPFFVLHRNGDGCLLPPTWHDHAMAIWQVVEGEICLTVGTEFLQLRAGDIFFVPSSVVYSARTLSEHASMRALVFETSILEQNMASLDSELLYMFEVQSRIRVPHFSSEDAVYPTLTRFFSDAIEEYMGKDVCYKLPIRADIYMLMTVLLRQYGIARNEQDRMVYHNVLRMRPVLEYIKKNLDQKLTIGELSAMLHVSTDHFTRMFKESIGRTPVDYINGMRVVRAQRMLCATEDSLADIAQTIGFCNANYFHKIFKQYMNESPLSYRKNAKDSSLEET